jgi:hypothetical protein
MNTTATVHHAPEFADTDPRALRVWMEMLRSRTPGEKIAMVFELTEMAMAMAEAGVRARYPRESEKALFLRCAALRLPRDLMVRAYGWDPDGGLSPETATWQI